MKRDTITIETNTLASGLNKMIQEGFTEDFMVTESGLLSLKTEKKYSPENVQVVNFFRFEGASDPADNSIVYAILTNDGTKGTLTDAYGPYADPNVTKFMKQVEDITKKPG